MKDLTPYLDDDDVSDLRTNHFQPRVDDVHHGNYNPSRKAKSNMQEDLDGLILFKHFQATKALHQLPRHTRLFSKSLHKG